MLPLLLAVCFLLCACSEEPVPATTTVQTAPTETTATTVPSIPDATYQAPMIVLSVPTVTEESYSDNNTLVFSYTTQNFSLILPDPQVAEAVTIDYMNRVDFSNSAANSVYEAALTAFPQSEDWTPYFYNELYSPQRLDQVVLSLYGAETLYDGSPRSTSVAVSLNYDLLTGTPLEEITQVLAEDYSAEKLCQLITDELKPLADAGTLFIDYEYIISDMFTTNYPVTNWYFSKQGLCFFFTPYEIAPYNAGTITVVLPYEALNGMIKDAYFPMEQPALYGTAKAAPYSADTQYAQLAEVILDGDASRYTISTDGALFDVRLVCAGENVSDSEITVLAAATLCKGDGIILQCNESTLARLSLSYVAGGDVVVTPLSALIP